MKKILVVSCFLSVVLTSAAFAEGSFQGKGNDVYQAKKDLIQAKEQRLENREQALEKRHEQFQEHKQEMSQRREQGMGQGRGQEFQVNQRPHEGAKGGRK